MAGKCTICAEDIQDGAKKCIKCGSYQNRLMRCLTFLDTVLALLVALVAVIGALGPPFVKALHKEHSDLRARLKATGPVVGNGREEIDPGSATTYTDIAYSLGVEIVAWNTGDLPTAFHSGQLELKKNGATIAAGELQFSSEDSVIGPREYRIVKATARLKTFDDDSFPSHCIADPDLRHTVRTSGGAVRVQYFQYSGSRESTEEEVWQLPAGEFPVKLQ